MRSRLSRQEMDSGCWLVMVLRLAADVQRNAVGMDGNRLEDERNLARWHDLVVVLPCRTDSGRSRRIP